MEESKEFVDNLESQEQDTFIVVTASELLDVIYNMCDQAYKNGCTDGKEEAEDGYYGNALELIDWIEHEWKYLSQEKSLCSTNEFLSKTIKEFLEVA